MALTGHLLLVMISFSGTDQHLYSVVGDSLQRVVLCALWQDHQEDKILYIPGRNGPSNFVCEMTECGKASNPLDALSAGIIL